MTEPTESFRLDRSLLARFWAEAQLPPERRARVEFQSRRFPSVGELLARHGRLDGQRVLDLGGGVGSLSVALHAALGGEYDLAEYESYPEVHRAALARYGVGRVLHSDLSGADPLAGVPSGYQLVLFVEVLEHLLANPLDVFRAIRDHLAPGGRLLLTTPNPARLSNRLKLLAGRSIKEVDRYPTDGSREFGHVIEYGSRELDQLLAVEGFAPIETRVIQQSPAPRPSARQRAGVAVLNSRLFRTLELGDDVQGLYRRLDVTPAPRPARI